MEIICYACGKGEYPENTLVAIQHCQNVNSNWTIEMDLHMTKDGEVILFHDDNLKRITGLNIQVQDLTLKYIKELNAGYNFIKDYNYPYREKSIRIPTLDQVFENFPNANFLLDIHSNNLNIIEKIIPKIEATKFEDKIVIVSKHHHILSEFKHKKPYWVYGASLKEVKRLVISSQFWSENLFPLKSDIFMIPIIHGNRKILTDRLINYLNGKNKKLWVWLYEGKQVITITNRNQFKKAKKLNADGVFTSFPRQLSKDLALKKE